MAHTEVSLSKLDKEDLIRLKLTKLTLLLNRKISKLVTGSKPSMVGRELLLNYLHGGMQIG